MDEFLSTVFCSCIAIGYFSGLTLLSYEIKQDRYPWVASLSHLCSPWNSYLPLSCHFWSCPEVLCLIPDCRKLYFFFLTQSTRWYRNALIISFHRKSKLVQAYRISFFWLVRILFCFVNFVLPMLALIPFSVV